MIPESVLARARDEKLVAGIDTQIHPGGETATRVYLARIDTHGAALRVVSEAESWAALVWPK